MTRQLYKRRLLFSFLFILLSFEVFVQNIDQNRTLRILSTHLNEQHLQRRTQTLMMADSLNIPVRIEKDGVVMELQYFRNGVPRYYITHNKQGAVLIKTSQVWPGGDLGLNLTGAGQTLGMWDADAPLHNHQELIGRTMQMDDAITTHYHATHVAATMIAGGVDDAAQGMSYEANLHTYDWGNDEAEMADAALKGLKISQHSYGYAAGWSYNGEEWYWYGDINISKKEDYSFGFYDQEARTWDLISNNAPNYLIVKSAGNSRGEGPAAGTSHKVWMNGKFVVSTEVRPVNGGTTGYDVINGAAVSKNVLSVGAVNSTRQMSRFSSWGPTDDGRIKPDVVAKGVNVYSATDESPTSYVRLNGTSMSSPMVSGSAGLLLQHHQELYDAPAPMLSATLKGIIIHTADNLNGNNSPDYRSGWGLMNTRRAAQVMSANAQSGGNHNIRELILRSGEPIALHVVATGDEPLKATIVWNDPAATVTQAALNARNSKLVNDLDMRILNGNQDSFMPWVLSPEAPSAVAVTGDNTVDNVEQIFIEKPVAGQTYSIIINHKKLLVGLSQKVSLIITGITPDYSAYNVLINVKDLQNNPVEGAAIKFDGNTVVTDANGHYNFDAPEGTFNISIEKPGFTLINQTIIVTEQRGVYNFILIPEDQQVQVYPLSVSTSPIAGGVASGEGKYPAGAEVVVLASPVEGYRFISWNDEQGNVISDQATFTYTMAAETTTLNAIFAVAGSYRVNLLKNPVEMGTVFGSGDYYEGTQAILLAVAAEGYSFKNWTDSNGNIVSTEARFIYTVGKSNATFTANFELTPPGVISVIINPPGAGTIEGTGSYLEGESVTLTATPGQHYEFVSWTNHTGEILGTENSLLLVMPGRDLELTANFKLKKYALTLDIEGEGNVYINDSLYLNTRLIEYGTVVNITADPLSGWQFRQWKGDVVSTSSDETFVMEGNTVIGAEFFSEVFYQLSLIKNPSFGGVVTGEGEYHPWVTTSLMAIPAPGFRFVGWTDTQGNMINSTSQLNFRMPEGDTSLVAVFTITHKFPESKGTAIFIFPNPAQQYINIGSNEQFNLIQVIDLDGKVVYSEETLNNVVRLELSGFIGGFYFLRVFFDDEVLVKKFQVLK